MAHPREELDVDWRRTKTGKKQQTGPQQIKERPISPRPPLGGFTERLEQEVPLPWPPTGLKAVCEARTHTQPCTYARTYARKQRTHTRTKVFCSNDELSFRWGVGAN